MTSFLYRWVVLKNSKIYMKYLTVMRTLKSELKVRSNLVEEVICRWRILFVICRDWLVSIGRGCVTLCDMFSAVLKWIMDCCTNMLVNKIMATFLLEKLFLNILPNRVNGVIWRTVLFGLFRGSKLDYLRGFKISQKDNLNPYVPKSLCQSY